MSIRIALVIVPLFTAVAALADDAPDPVQSWTFDDGPEGWRMLQKCELSAQDGVLKVAAESRDARFATVVKSPAGWQEVTVRLRFEGVRNLQLYWRTEAEPKHSELRSVPQRLTSTNPEQWLEQKLYFKTDSPVILLAINPDKNPTVTEFDSITLRHAAPPVEVATDPASLKLPPGFRAELLYSVPLHEYGSWVSLAIGPNGTFFVSDQHGKLYRVTPSAIDSDAEIIVEPLPVELGMAQGLLWAFDALYVMINGTAGDGPGLYRVKDTDGDGLPETGELLKALDAPPSEHGPHAIVLSPDGMSLHVIAGNFTKWPEDIRKPSRCQHYDEDQLLPRNPATNNHATGIMAPGGWVCKVDPDGKDWDVICAGFRNCYDLAFNADGELFTFDSDMEMDVGTPWYRPTRVCHVVSGGEYGWRYGTGSWPAHYAESLPPVVDVGLGSPTGVGFGYGAKFPAKYQEALFISDWTNGKMYAVHLKEQGASYTGDLEEFISGTPLPLTDLVINPADGAMYFTIGGRKTQSGFYRVTYHGPESTRPAERKINDEAGTARARRRQLERYHTSEQKLRDDHWDLLNSPDRFLRFAARIAVEHQPVERWLDRALAEQRPTAATMALLAHARYGEPKHQLRILAALDKLDWKPLTSVQRLELLRTYGVTFIRLGTASPETAKKLSARLINHFPSDDLDVNHELCALLAYLNSDKIVAKALPLMKAAKTQEDRLSYAMSLRVVTNGWTPALRREYFDLLNQSENAAASGDYTGGGHLQVYIRQMRDQAKERLTGDELAALKDVLEAPIVSAIPGGSPTPRKFIRAWALDDLLPDLPRVAAGRSFEQGKELYLAANCAQCHRFNNTGGVLGPDITQSVKRYSRQKLLQEIMEPSVSVSDQYQTHQITTASGKVYEGRILSEDAQAITMAADPTRPAYLVTIPLDEIEEKVPSKVSMMPAGLLNTLTKEEILDLLAYLESAGNPKHAAFQSTGDR